jgi:hypothetical protein
VHIFDSGELDLKTGLIKRAVGESIFDDKPTEKQYQLNEDDDEVQ